VGCSDLDLLQRHIEAVWGVHLPPLAVGDVEVTTSGGATPWMLYVARTDAGEVRAWRDVPAAARAELVERGRRALPPVGENPGEGVVGEVVFRRPCPLPALDGAAKRLGEADRPALEVFEPGESAYWLDPRRAPLFGVVEAGRLVSVAHSSRRTAAACELGINTQVETRRRGFARACVLAWTRAVLEEGLEPLYSADRTNAPSLALARACGYRAFARAARVGETTSAPS